MFIRYYTVVERSFADTETEFLRGAERWMPNLAYKANGHGMQLLSELGFKVGDRRISRRIDIHLGEPLMGTGLTLVPLRWRASAKAALFPVLDGHIEIAAIGASVTQVGLSASYEPPLGLVGKLADRAVMHRIAEVTVKDFVERVGMHLQG